MTQHYYAGRKPNPLEKLFDPTWTTMKSSLESIDENELEEFKHRMDRTRMRKRNILKKYSEYHSQQVSKPPITPNQNDDYDKVMPNN